MWTLLLALVAVSAPPERGPASSSVVQVTTWTVDACHPTLERPDSSSPQAVTLSATDEAVNLGLLASASEPDGSRCATAVLEVFSHDDVLIGAECQHAELWVVRTTTPWTQRQTAIVNYGDAAVFAVPYRGDGPYRTVRMAVVPTKPGQPGRCSVTAMPRVRR